MAGKSSWLPGGAHRVDGANRRITEPTARGSGASSPALVQDDIGVRPELMIGWRSANILNHATHAAWSCSMRLAVAPAPTDSPLPAR